MTSKSGRFLALILFVSGEGNQIHVFLTALVTFVSFLIGRFEGKLQIEWRHWRIIVAVYKLKVRVKMFLSFRVRKHIKLVSKKIFTTQKISQLFIKV